MTFDFWACLIKYHIIFFDILYQKVSGKTRLSHAVRCTWTETVLFRERGLRLSYDFQEAKVISWFVLESCMHIFQSSTRCLVLYSSSIRSILSSRYFLNTFLFHTQWSFVLFPRDLSDWIKDFSSSSHLSKPIRPILHLPIRPKLVFKRQFPPLASSQHLYN